MALLFELPVLGQLSENLKPHLRPDVLYFSNGKVGEVRLTGAVCLQSEDAMVHGHGSVLVQNSFSEVLYSGEWIGSTFSCHGVISENFRIVAEEFSVGDRVWPISSDGTFLQVEIQEDLSLTYEPGNWHQASLRDADYFLAFISGPGEPTLDFGPMIPPIYSRLTGFFEREGRAHLLNIGPGAPLEPGLDLAQLLGDILQRSVTRSVSESDSKTPSDSPASPDSEMDSSPSLVSSLRRSQERPSLSAERRRELRDLLYRRPWPATSALQGFCRELGGKPEGMPVRRLWRWLHDRTEDP